MLIMRQLASPMHVGMHQQRLVSCMDADTAVCSAEEAAGHQANDLQDQVAPASPRPCRWVPQLHSVLVVLCPGPLAHSGPACARAVPCC